MALLEGKSVLITGASSGIGKTLAAALARERPARMVLVSSPASSDALHGCGEKAKGEGAKDVQCLAADFKDGKQVDEMCSKAGAVDVLINCGGVFGPRGEDEQGPIKGDPSDWDDVMTINVMAPMRIVRRLGPAMCDNNSGVIMNIGDVEGEHSGPCHPAYAASAHAMRGWSLASYEKLRHRGVRVVLVEPGNVRREESGAHGATEKSAGGQGVISAGDVTEAVLFALRVSRNNAVPAEIVLKALRPGQ